MKPIKVTVKVEINTNWANQTYAMFSTEKHGNIAELDWPIEGYKGVRVYPLKKNEAEKDMTNHIGYSSIATGIIGAETATKAYLFDEGYYVTKFDYPKELAEIRKEAFKVNK